MHIEELFNLSQEELIEYVLTLEEENDILRFLNKQLNLDKINKTNKDYEDNRTMISNIVNNFVNENKDKNISITIDRGLL